MKSAPFRYIRANAISDVFEAYAQCDGEARIIAGGQSLMPLLNMRLAAPKALIDINGIDALTIGKYIEIDFNNISEKEAEKITNDSCKKLLVNPNTQTYTYKIE